ncbi:YpjP-like protein [Ureibacillus xyleni]|uniref:YpjP-like protein n=2 Tax=Ureibacillus xyleni TaxID=614648 RepID=A0A285T1Q9_9BACL|nr:YpjP-like protein [Ureibacillus xyleni]
MYEIEGDSMKKWWQKTLVISVALLTFGLITPNHEIWDALENGQASNNSQGSNIQTNNQPNTQISAVVEQEISTEDELPQQTIESILFAAKEQSYIKFGSRIAPVIGDEFEDRIFPKIEEAIQQTLTRMDNESIKYLSISNQPSQNGEKIFHITNEEDGQDLIRFHVRTEKRPQDGFYYNFHYHTVEDQFVAHHTLGDIYWSKNTPPKWLS